jgi:hypothetical protein
VSIEVLLVENPLPTGVVNSARCVGGSVVWKIGRFVVFGNYSQRYLWIGLNLV